MVDVQKFEEGRRLHPKTLVQRFMVSLPALVLILFPLTRGTDPNVYLTLLYAFLLLLFSLPLIVGHYLRFRYWITPKEIVIRSGIFNTQHRNIPIGRVQNIEVQRTVISRLLGLAKVNVQTAGSRGTEGVLEYVSEAEAEEIREVVRTFQRMAVGDTAPTHEGEQEDAKPAQPPALFALSLRRTFLSGMFRFSLVYVALFFSALQYLGLDVEEVVDWVATHQFEWMNALTEISPFLLGVASVMLVAFLAWITGIAINLNRFYGFRMAREGDKLHVRSGLLTVSERTIPLKKVQAVAVRTNPLMKSFGWYALELQTMGVEAEQQGRHSAMPFARLDEISDVASQLLSFRLPDQMDRVSKLHIRRVTLRLVLLTVATAAAMSFGWSGGWWIAALAPFAVYYGFCRYQSHRYALADEGLYIQRGVFKEYIWMLPAEKYQVFYDQASLFQRRLGLRTLVVDMAGSPNFGGPMIADLPAERAPVLVESLLRQFRSAGRPFPRLIKEDASSGHRPPEAQLP